MFKTRTSNGHLNAEQSFILAVTCYFALHIAIRVTHGASLELDEAEQAFVFQNLQLGYGTQPPLYNWLQWSVFSLFGFNLFSLSLLKNALLWLTYIGVLSLGKKITGTPGAIAASASLILFPQIGWEPQRDLTHSVLLLCLASLTLWSYFCLLQQPSRRNYALFGLLIGLGLQSKYNFVIFFLGLVGASLIIKEHRKLLWNRNVWTSAVVATICLLPHGIWLVENVDSALSGTLEKAGEGVGVGGYFQSVRKGLLSTVIAVLSFVPLLCITYGIAGWRCRDKDLKLICSSNKRFFYWFFGIALATITALVLTGEIGKIKDRWLLPILFPLPVALMAAFPGLLNKVALRQILVTCATIALLVIAGILFRIVISPTLGNFGHAHHPYATLADNISKIFPAIRNVIVEEQVVAGNLYFARPTWRIQRIDQLQSSNRMAGDQILLVMPETFREEQVTATARALGHSRIAQKGHVDVPLLYGKGRKMRYFYALIESREM